MYLVHDAELALAYRLPDIIALAFVPARSPFPLSRSNNPVLQVRHRGEVGILATTDRIEVRQGMSTGIRIVPCGTSPLLSLRPGGVLWALVV